MGAFAGGARRLWQTLLFFLAFCASGIVLGFYSYFLAVLSNRNEFIDKQWKAVEGISGVAVLYTIAGVVLTFCLGGFTFFGMVAVVLDVLFMGGFIAIAVLPRSGAKSCSGEFASSPLGTGLSNEGTGFDGKATYQVKFGTACRYNSASFGASIAGAVLFLLLALFQLLLVRHQQKDKAYGPGPSNNYTSGRSRRMRWGRKRDVEAGTVGGAAAMHHHEKENGVRPSNDTAFTGSTAAGNNYATPANTSANY